MNVSMLVVELLYFTFREWFPATFPFLAKPNNPSSGNFCFYVPKCIPEMLFCVNFLRFYFHYLILYFPVSTLVYSIAHLDSNVNRHKIESCYGSIPSFTCSSASFQYSSAFLARRH